MMIAVSFNLEDATERYYTNKPKFVWSNVIDDCATFEYLTLIYLVILVLK